MKKRVKPVTTVAARPEPTAIEKIDYARKGIEFYLNHELEDCIRVKTEFIKAVNKNDPKDLDLSYLVRRSAEEIMLSAAKEREVRGLLAAFQKNIDARDGGVEWVLEKVKAAQTEQRNRLLESPYRHNSTCAMSNFQQECELRAKADFWHGGGFGRSVVGQVIHYLEDWLAAEAEVLADYPELPEVVDGWRD